MTDQEILGDMNQFFISYEGSFITEFYNEQTDDRISQLPPLIRDMAGMAELVFTSDDVNKEIEEGLLKAITKTEYLAKYRELEDN